MSSAITCEPTPIDHETWCSHCEERVDALYILNVAGCHLMLCRECITNVASAVHPHRRSFYFNR